MASIKNLLIDAANMLAASSESAHLDAEILLCLALNKQRSYLRAWPENEPTTNQETLFKSYLQERYLGKPIAYILGYKEFWSRDFKVTPDVLIPRPDTELIIELCLDVLPLNSTANILDLGTGSGIIGITLAAERPHCQVIASDFSLAALNIAKLNAQAHHLNNITFYQSDWLKNIPKQKFEIIVSNPPYIAKDDEHLTLGDLRFEPTTALSANDYGLSDIKTIINHARDYLAPQGHLLIEHGYNQKNAVQDIFNDFNYQQINTHIDLSEQPRVTRGQWQST
ncbi:MAG: peptide chain release factor N(5)-glutamine methyltransferase [Methylococcales bacterium]|nr:peptide chain release factor N(5)-glutamine methyltransferase [Methylococcales bacterium]